MAVFRVERTRDYTVMSNYHLRDTRMSLKAVGLLSKMLSLTDEWNYNTRGLASICKEGVDAIGAALKELEKYGYLERTQLRDDRGRITDTEYVIYEAPHTPKTPLPDTDSPDTENPDMDNPDTVSPDTEKPALLNKEQSSTKKSNTQGLNIDSCSIPHFSQSFQQSALTPLQEAWKLPSLKAEYESYRALIAENIEYDFLIRNYPIDREIIDEIFELMVETVCAKRKMTRVAGSSFPHEVVKSRLLKLDSEHIRYAMKCMEDNTSKVVNIKQYLLTVLFNAPTTINNYYAAQVNHAFPHGG